MKSNIYDERKELIEDKRKTNILIKELRSEIKDLKAKNKKLGGISHSYKDKYGNVIEKNEELTIQNKKQQLKMDIIFRISVVGVIYNLYLIYIKYFPGN